MYRMGRISKSEVITFVKKGYISKEAAEQIIGNFGE